MLGQQHCAQEVVYRAGKAASEHKGELKAHG